MEGGRRGEEKGCGEEEEESPSLLAAILAGGEGRRAVWALGRAYVFEVSLFSVARLPERLPGEGARLGNASVENEIGVGCQPR